MSARIGRSRITRRRVVSAAGLLLGGYLLDRDFPRQIEPLEALLRHMLSMVALPDPVAVGQAYLALDPWDTDPNLFLEAVFGDLLEPKADAQEIARRFCFALQHDFERGNTLHLADWVVSRREARFCALLAVDRHHGPPLPV